MAKPTRRTPPAPRELPLAAIAWAPLAGLAALVIHVLRVRPWMLDDAYIFFRYADNWASGHGPVFNPGERVEGYTSFLWLALLTVGRAFGADPVRSAHVLGWIGALASMVLVTCATRFVTGLPRHAGPLAALFLGTAGWFTAWTESGMEVMLASPLLTACVLLYARGARRWLLGLLFGAFALVRPEGLFVFAAACAHAAFEWRAQRRASGSTARPPFALLAGFAAVVLPHLVWRIATYGDWLPNTFYAKSGLTAASLLRGATYAGKFALAAAPLVAGALALRASIAGRFGRFVPLLLAVWAGIVVLEGGDAMPACRFFAPVAPILCLATAAVLTRRLGVRGALGAAVAIATWNLGASRWVHDIDPRLRHDRVALAGVAIGEWMRQHFDPEDVIATNTAGSLPYASRLRAIDMLGLNDRHIARRRVERIGQGTAGHEKGDGEYVLSRRPEWIQFGSVRGSKTPGFPGDKEIAASPAFASYRLEQFDVLIEGRRHVLSLYRREDVPRPRE